MHMISRVTTLMSGLLLTGVAPAALAGIDTFKLAHSSGPCADFTLPTGHLSWSNLARIRIATGETIRVTLFGHGADLATDATGAEIYESIDGKGRTTNYPNAPIVMGSKIPKGYVVIAIKAISEHGTGNRSVTVKWATGNETIPLKIVATCEELRGAPYRTAPSPPSEQSSGTPTLTPPPNPPYTYCTVDPNPSTPDPCN